MRVTMLSTDRTILRPDTAAANRMRAYGTLCDSLLILVAGTGKEMRISLSDRVTVIHPGGATKAINFFRLLYASRIAEADIVSAQDPLWTGLIGVFSKKPVVQVQVHTDSLGILGKIIAPYVLRRASCVRVVSEKIATHVRLLTHAPVSVLPIYVDAEVYSRPMPRPVEYGTHPVILMVSRLAPEKRVHLAIEALVEVPNAHLYIVGDGSLRARLEKLVQRLGLDGRVHFLGWRNSVAPYYQHADAYVQTSAFEGYGMALFEAALAGCPIVSTNVGIVHELPQGSATIVEKPEYELVHALTDSLTSERKTAARAAQQELATRMPSFSQYLDEYKRVLTSCKSL